MKILSIDAETNGLWGQVFAIGAILYENDIEVQRASYRCPIEGEVDPWVRENVLPRMEDMPVTHESYLLMLYNFSAFYLVNKTDAHVITHVAFPVETGLFMEMHNRGYISDWGAPFPLLDISSMLLMAGEDPNSVDKYAKKFNLLPGEVNAHNPLYDCEVTMKVFINLMDRAAVRF